MNVRKATQEDEDRVIEMAQNFYSVAGYEDFIPFDEETCRGLFRSSLSCGLCFVAVDSSDLVGFVLGMAVPSMMNKEYLIGAELAWWVEPEYRGSTGIRLLKAIQDQAQSMGLKMWSMMALESQDPEKVEKIYLEMGYTKTERTYTRVH